MAIFRKKVYKVSPENVQVFTDFFHQYLYPNQMRYGSKLVGRWVNEKQNEIMAIWEYESIEQYHNIEQKIRESELHRQAQEKRKEMGNLYIESSQEFLSTTGNYHDPKHIVSVSAYITNEKGEVLLVKNHHRSDTYEMPGGQVEEGESLHEAICREVMEETGVEVKLYGITGIYQSLTSRIFCIVFRGGYVSGTPRPAEGETQDVLFTRVDQENVDQWIKRPHFKTRLLDAIQSNYIPYESFKVRPYELIERYEAIQED